MHITIPLINDVGQVFDMNIGYSYHNAVCVVLRTSQRAVFRIKKSGKLMNFLLGSSSLGTLTGIDQ
jgi:hypothetical protein